MTGPKLTMEEDEYPRRAARSKEQTRENYNRMSRFYGLLSACSEKQFVNTAIERFLKPEKGERILEPGFGAGHALAALAEMVGDEGRVYGIDISDGMVEVTRKRLRRKGLGGRVLLTRGDAAALPYADDFFDGIFMGFTLELFDPAEIPVVLSECRRVLREDGRISVAAMSGQDRRGVMMELYKWSYKRFPKFVDCRPIFARGFIEDAGFEVTGHKVMFMWGLPVEIVLGRKGS